MQLCPTHSIWTIDLAHLLAACGARVQMLTITIGANQVGSAGRLAAAGLRGRCASVHVTTPDCPMNKAASGGWPAALDLSPAALCPHLRCATLNLPPSRRPTAASAFMRSTCPATAVASRRCSRCDTTMQHDCTVQDRPVVKASWCVHWHWRAGRPCSPAWLASPPALWSTLLTHLPPIRRRHPARASLCTSARCRLQT